MSEFDDRLREIARPAIEHTIKIAKELTMTLPTIHSTQAERVTALREAKSLLVGGGTKKVGAFSSETTSPATPDTLDLFRIADYITTGHDYIDTHKDTDDE